LTGRQDALWDHVDEAAFRGSLAEADVEALAVNPLCGDEVRLQLRLDAAGGVEAARFTGRGCRVSQAAASRLCERIAGLGREALERLEPREVLAWGGVELSPVRRMCALTGYEAMMRALGKGERKGDCKL
jgi:nitrogen fixation NifU-like protein